MTPAQMIADLDYSLDRDGATATLEAMASGVATKTATVKAFLRGATPDELIAGVTQKQFRGVLSPTAIAAANWVTGGSGTQDKQVPRKSDRLTMNGFTYTVEVAFPIYVQGVLVRINLHLVGG